MFHPLLLYLALACDGAVQHLAPFRDLPHVFQARELKTDVSREQADESNWGFGFGFGGSDKVSSIEPIQEKEKAFSRESRATIRETRTVVLESAWRET